MKKILYLSLIIALLSCTAKTKYDATGIFESEDLILSSELSGIINKYYVQEGDSIAIDDTICVLDTTQLQLEKIYLNYQSLAILKKQPDMTSQLDIIKSQINNAESERKRISHLYDGNAATMKQIDDVNHEIDILNKQYKSLSKELELSTNYIDYEYLANEAMVKKTDYLLGRSHILSPIKGIALNTYVTNHEFVTVGQPICRISDISKMYLKIYVVYEQLKQLYLGKEVIIDLATQNKNEQSYIGYVTWISEYSEFTPKTIQTKDERQNLVYAVKIEVTNIDGMIKNGMYGDVQFQPE